MPHILGPHADKYADCVEITTGIFVAPGDAVYIVDHEGEIVTWNADEVAEDGEAFTAAIVAAILAARYGARAIRENLATDGYLFRLICYQTRLRSQWHVDLGDDLWSRPVDLAGRAEISLAEYRALRSLGYPSRVHYEDGGDTGWDDSTGDGHVLVDRETPFDKALEADRFRIRARFTTDSVDGRRYEIGLPLD